MKVSVEKGHKSVNSDNFSRLLLRSPFSTTRCTFFLNTFFLTTYGKCCDMCKLSVDSFVSFTKLFLAMKESMESNYPFVNRVAQGNFRSCSSHVNLSIHAIWVSMFFELVLVSQKVF